MTEGCAMCNCNVNKAMADAESPAPGRGVVCSQCGALTTPDDKGSNGALSTVSTIADLLPCDKSVEAAAAAGQCNHGGDSVCGTPSPYKRERSHILALQVALPFFIAGFGTIGAGVVFGKVAKWTVFNKVRMLFIVVPALLGLKGNLDMCLASRLSTQANLGNLESWRSIRQQVVSNIALVQVQAAVASLLVAIVAVAGGSMRGQFEFKNAVLVTASTVTTACTTCFVLDLVLITVIIASHRLKLNPDNIVCPVAASIGDIVSLTVLSTLASRFYEVRDTHWWVCIVFIAFFFCLLPVWLYFAVQQNQTKRVLVTGWIPVVNALIISSAGGYVLDSVVNRFQGFAVFQPIINGIGGNLASVQSSRIATSLHQTTFLGVLTGNAKMCVSPLSALFHGDPQAKSARILIAMAIPGEVFFIFIADYINNWTCTLSLEFVSAYLAASITQIMILLYIGHIMVHAMWKAKIDPDNSAIPYLTALGDFLGTSLLALAFAVLEWNGTPYATK